MTEETLGLMGYTSKGRLATSQVVYVHPDGGQLLFESIVKNGVNGVIIHWLGEGVLVLPFDKFAALTALVSPETFLSLGASGTEAGTGETEGLDPKGDGPTLEERDAQTPVPSSRERK